MKCPECGKWNQSGMLNCEYCWAPLPREADPDRPAWMDDLQVKTKTYINVDEHGYVEEAYDRRDLLASRMADLKVRTQEGIEQRQQIEQRVPRTQQQTTPQVKLSNSREAFYEPMPAGGERVAEQPLTPEQERERFGVNAPQPVELVNPYEMYPEQGDYARMRYNQPDPARDEREFYQTRSMKQLKHRYRPRAFSRLRKALPWVLGGLLLVIAAAVAISLISANNTDTEKPQATVMPTIRDDLAAHTVSIPGEEGQRITIRELRTSAVVVGGVATFDILDHIWYDNYENALQDSMMITLTPYITMDNGRQQALDPVKYEIDIPLSPIELDTPPSLYQEVSTALYSIVFYVREGSSLTINGEDYSDMVNTSGGKVTYNATVQPIGENYYEIKVRSQYCRENTMTVTLYRAKQEIPLDLASDVATSTSTGTGTITISGTTLPGAVVKVLSPHMDLNVTNTPIDGTFSFVAKFDRMGTNTVIITADYPGKATTRVEHNIYWVPNIDVYSRKAWDIVAQYTDLMDNIELRKKNSQIYVCKGVITSLDTVKPQRVFMNVGTEESPVYVYLENSSKTTWELGGKYRVYGDVFGMYDGKPWLVARYTYSEDK